MAVINNVQRQKVGLKIKELRQTLNLSSNEFAEKLQINKSFLNLIEKGCITLSTSDKNKIKETFCLTDSWLEELNLDEEKPAKQKKVHAKDNSMGNLEIAEITDDEIIQRLLVLKKLKGYTQSEVADLTQINRSQLSLIENKKIAMSKKARFKLIQFLKLDQENLADNTTMDSVTFVSYDSLNNKEIIRKSIIRLKESRDMIDRQIASLEQLL